MSRSDPHIDGETDIDISSDSSSHPQLWVKLSVDMYDTPSCPLSESREKSVCGSIQLVGAKCHLMIRPDASESTDTVRTISSRISEDCLCPSIGGGGFAPVELSVAKGQLVIGAYATDRSAISAVTSSLDAEGNDWHLDMLTTTDNEDSVPKTISAAVDELSITTKQREAVTTAVKKGYYDRPRNATLGDIADALGVTRSAISQRLNTVESKLVTNLSGDLS